MNVREYPSRVFRALEICGDHWLNSDPVPDAALGGNVALLVFWDFACGASLHTLQYVREWDRRYRPCGLVVVGVHTPKFAFGSERDTVRQAVRRLGVDLPVVMDNGYRLWSQYGISVWPTLTNVLEELPESMVPLRQTDMPGAACYRVSPELFAGYQRGSVGNVEGQVPEATSRYADPGIYADGRFYLEGNWLCTRDTVLNRTEEASPSRLILPYAALEVNGVLKSESGSTVNLMVQQDDRSLTEENRGRDVRIEDNGSSILVVGEASLYNIVKNRDFGAHVLRLGVRESGLAVYSFAFVSDIIHETISKN
jgi:hypothetical protein